MERVRRDSHVEEDDVATLRRDTLALLRGEVWFREIPYAEVGLDIRPHFARLLWQAVGWCKISVTLAGAGWLATAPDGTRAVGETPEIAAARCFRSYRRKHPVELPEEDEAAPAERVRRTRPSQPERIRRTR